MVAAHARGQAAVGEPGDRGNDITLATEVDIACRGADVGGAEDVGQHDAARRILELGLVRELAYFEHAQECALHVADLGLDLVVEGKDLAGLLEELELRRAHVAVRARS